MQIKTNIRAGAGSNSGGVNSKKGLSTDSSSSSVTVAPPPPPPPVYYPPVGRCVGY